MKSQAQENQAQENKLWYRDNTVVNTNKQEISLILIVPHREKKQILAYAKTKALISCAITAQLIMHLFSLHG